MYSIVSHPLCPFAHQLVMAARASGLLEEDKISVKYIPYSELPTVLPKISPSGSVPVLLCGDTVIAEETAVAACALSVETEFPFFGASAVECAAIVENIRIADSLRYALRPIFTAKSQSALDDGIDSFVTLLNDNATIQLSLNPDRMDTMAWASAITLVNDHPRLANTIMSHTPVPLKKVISEAATLPMASATRPPSLGETWEAFFRTTNSEFQNLNIERISR